VVLVACKEGVGAGKIGLYEPAAGRRWKVRDKAGRLSYWPRLLARKWVYALMLLLISLWSLLAIGQLPVAAPPPPPPPQQGAPQSSSAATSTPKPGTVHGHVYAADTGAGVKHADVTLLPSGRFQPQQGNTDAQGGFEFRNVDPGDYTLSCSKSGFVGASYGAKSSNAPAAKITVRDSQDLKDIDCRMQKGGVITGVVTNDEGDPVVFGQVQVMVKTYRRGQPTLTAGKSASTDDRGRYRIFDLSPGRYYVQASRPGSGPTNSRDTAYTKVIYPGASRLQDAEAVQLLPGAEVGGIDMVLRIVSTYSITGKVVDMQSGRALAGGNVNAMAEDFMMNGGGGGAQIKQDGTFQVKGLLPGRYRLTVSAGFGGRGGFGGDPGGGPGGRGGPGGGGGPRPFTKEVELSASNIDNLTITITPGSTVKGKLEATGGAVPDNSRVSLTPRSDNVGFRGPGMVGQAQVNPDGTFEIADVQPGTYDLAVMNRGGMGAPGGFGGFNAPPTTSSGFFLSALSSGGSDVLDSGIVVPEGGASVQIAATIDFSSASVTGHALTEDGGPMGGVPVVLVSSDPKKRLIDRYFKTTFADINGNYSISSVIPGSYIALVWPGTDPYQVQDPDLLTQLEQHATRISVERGGTASQDLKLTSAITVIAQAFAQ
jgi:hypothetical protein